MSLSLDDHKSRCVRFAAIIAVAFAAGFSFAGSVHATAFNIDYQTISPCTDQFGGIALPIAGIVTPTDYFMLPNNDYSPIASTCGSPPANTLVNWACTGTNGQCLTCIANTTSVFLHVGYSAPQASMVTGSAWLYSTVPANTNCKFTVNLPLTDACNPSNYLLDCDIPRPPPRPYAAAVESPIRFQPLAATGWQVHTDGQTLTVINGMSIPPSPCPWPVYVGDVRFHYYATHQPLQTLNAESLGEAIAVDTAAAGVVACGDTLDFIAGGGAANVPPNAKFLVVSATQDSVPSLDSPRASHVWIEEVIVREGEHLITAISGPHGKIDPEGPVVVADGGSQTFTIIPDADYRVADVKVDGASVGAVTSYTISNVAGDHTIIAEFAPLNAVPDCAHVTAVPSQLWPPNHRMVPVRLSGITDVDGDPVTVKITRITQDEPNGPPSGGPSATSDSTDACQLRAERAGNGNGRVYTIWFTADDGNGGTCDGSAQVCVPHDRGHLACVDDGQEVDALLPGSLPSEKPGQEKKGKSAKLELSATTFVGDEATVEFSIPTAAMVQLAVYDIAGRRVATIEHAPLGEGSHTAIWNAGGLAKGIYFYRLQSGSAAVTKALVLR